MTHKANYTIVVGKGEDAKTIAAGETVTGLPADEIKRLRELGAIDGPPPGEELAAQTADPAPAAPLADGAHEAPTAQRGGKR